MPREVSASSRPRANAPSRSAPTAIGPGFRVALKSSWFDVAGSYDGYYEPSGFQGLSTGSVLNTHARRVEFEGQVNHGFRHNLVRIIVGGDVSDEHMTSRDPILGTQTFLSHPVDLKRQALFGQATWNANARSA
jgi:hypothetical protein